MTRITERIYPNAFNANFVTLMGQIPQLITLALLFKTMGFDISGDTSRNDDNVFFFCGLAILWFTQHDLMDGARARRQKAGSPFGRLFDEANDMIQMTCY